jgi:hypothetical protein
MFCRRIGKQFARLSARRRRRASQREEEKEADEFVSQDPKDKPVTMRLHPDAIAALRDLDGSGAAHEQVSPRFPKIDGLREI